MADTTPSASGSSPDSPGDGKVRRSVLIIDDDPVHLRIYGWILEAAGYRPITAMAHLDGIDLPDEPVDIVLLDYHLTGGMQATDAAVLVRQTKSARAILPTRHARPRLVLVGPPTRGQTRASPRVTLRSRQARLPTLRLIV